LLKIISKLFSSINNFTLLSLFVLLIQPAASLAQNPLKRPDSSIDRLRGGNIGMNFKWSGAAFSGLGTRADAMGGSISTLYPGAESIHSNPAGLGFANGFALTLIWSPPLTIDPGGIIGIEDRINDGLKQAVEDNPPIDPVTGEFKSAKDVVENSNVNTELDMRGGLKGGILMYGNPTFSIAAAFHQPFRLESQINMSGFEFLAAALDDDGDVTHRIFGTINGNLNLNLTVETSSIGFGTEILPDFSFGVVYDNFNGDMNFEGTFLPEGIISSAGDTKPFNDPRSVQYDSLFAKMKGNWEGDGHRFRSGLGFHPKHNISFDLVFSSPFTIDLKGPFSMVHNNIRALNLDAAEDEEVFDVDILVEDNLTKTEKLTTQIPGMDLQVPGFLSLGYSMFWDHYLTSFVFTKYFGELGYEFSYDQFDSLGVKTRDGTIQQRMNLKSAFRLGVGVEQLILGLGILFGETYEEHIYLRQSENEPNISNDTSNFFAPFFSLGGGIDISSSFRLDYVLNVYQSSFFRFSTTYHL